MMRSNRPTHSPFDSTAIDRLRRMGLATADGSVERDAMAVFCCIFAGQFYDDLCDYHQDDVQAVKAAVTPWWMAWTPAIPRKVPDDLPAI